MAKAINGRGRHGSALQVRQARQMVEAIALQQKKYAAEVVEALAVINIGGGKCAE
jgi:hypothetical protein